MEKAKSKSRNKIYDSILKILNHRKQVATTSENDVAEFCFMIHDEVMNEIQKIEMNELHEWLADGSFEKQDKLYISFLLKKY